jgi:hypothetical protein
VELEAAEFEEDRFQWGGALEGWTQRAEG